MRKVLFLLFLVPGLLLAQTSRTQDAQNQARPVNPALSERWVVSADFYGTPINPSLELKQEGDKVTGNFDGDKLEGSLSGNSIHFLARDEQGGTRECKATIHDGTMSGTIVVPTLAMLPTPPRISSRPKWFRSAGLKSRARPEPSFLSAQLRRVPGKPAC